MILECKCGKTADSTKLGNSMDYWYEVKSTTKWINLKDNSWECLDCYNIRYEEVFPDTPANNEE